MGSCPITVRVLKAAPKQTENVIKDNGLLQRDYLAKATNGSREGEKKTPQCFFYGVTGYLKQTKNSS